MPAYDLPETVEVGGTELAIRSDFRAALDVITVLNDAELTDAERGAIALAIFYEDPDSIPRDGMQEAGDRLMWFLRGGEDRDRGRRGPRLMDWEQDLRLVVAPVNRVLGFEARACGHLHWWTFLSAYYEIGDCLFAQVVAIRRKQREGRKLDDQERKFYRDNREIVDLRTRESAEEAELFDQWIGG